MSEPNLIPLQTAYATKANVIGEDWKICNADTDKVLKELPGTLDERGVMSYLHFARSFELEALNIGIAFGAAREAQKSEDIFQDLKTQNLFLQQQNEMLSGKLEQIIIGNEEQ